jgi:hypothetical protein
VVGAGGPDEEDHAAGEGLVGAGQFDAPRGDMVGSGKETAGRRHLPPAHDETLRLVDESVNTFWCPTVALREEPRMEIVLAMLHRWSMTTSLRLTRTGRQGVPGTTTWVSGSSGAEVAGDIYDISKPRAELGGCYAIATSRCRSGDDVRATRCTIDKR